ncbi:putative MFS family arabinose efflux permease [Kribbella sp. VKM Ac-2571]|uniref:MFS transporter n=1 Tax=Kribbella sp. VKM Ac-2571 TaxID=2512222 RepID=UPI00105C59AF|nr:MFS transporter [Kribbella sp. VKM Ac-2571]TDO67622.1 putative MFS family arabinose efflux permease [Kribbella sp. VKM Ac-2571]
MTELLFPLGGRRAWAVWATAVLTYLVTVLHRGSMSVAGLQAAERFDISASALASFTVVQLTVYAAMQVPVGVLLDRYGSKRLLITASGLLFVAQSAFSLVDSYPAALAARAVLGVGDALVFISVLRVVMSWFPALRQPVMSQATGMLGGLGAIMSTVPMAAAFHAFGWTTTFASASVLSLLAGVLVLFLIKDTPYDEPLRRAKQPLHEVKKNLRRAWQEPGTRLGLWTHFTTSFSGSTFGLLWGYPFLVQGQGLAPTTAAAMLIIPVLAGLCYGPLVGRYAAKFPFYRSWIVLAVIAGSVVMWTVVLLWPGRAPLPVLLALIVVQAAGGPGSMLGLDYARTFNPTTRFGAANGMVNTGGFIATLICIGMVGVLLDASSGGAPQAIDDFKFALAFQYVLWAIGTRQILKYRRKARGNLARYNPDAYQALLANEIVPLKG